MKFCAACGAALQGPSRFCVQCGAPAGAGAPAGGQGRPLPAPLAPPNPAAPSTAPTVPVPHVASPAAGPLTAPTPTSSSTPSPASAELPPLQAARTHTQVNLPALLLALMALALIAGGVTFLAMRDDGPSTPAATSTVPTTASPASSLQPNTQVPLDPAQQLAATRDGDRAAVEALIGQWVPQLSAKREGTQADGITYQLADIVALQSRLHGQYGALLLWSGDYVFAQGDVWVSVVPKGFATADEALAWCAAVPLDRDNCLAKLITHDPTVGDTAKLQP